MTNASPADDKDHFDHVGCEAAFAAARLDALAKQTTLTDIVAALDEILTKEYSSIRAAWLVGNRNVFHGKQMGRAILLEKAHDFLKDKIIPNQRQVMSVVLPRDRRS